MPANDQRTAAIRDFNRFYTRRIGALGDAHMGSGFSLTEVRVLYELAHRSPVTASEIAATLDLDRGYLSRTLRKFKSRGLITTSSGIHDRRRAPIRLTTAGRRAFAPLDKATEAAVDGMLQPLPDAARQRVVDAMRTIRSSLDLESIAADHASSHTSYIVRDPQPGDLGWIVHRHGALYWQEYRYDQRFEAIVARIVADFVDQFDAAREKCWVAERDGVIIGSIFVVAKSKRVAKLRLLLVEPSARGMGLGRRLVDEVIHFSKKAGYRKIELWTQAELTAARRIYESAGFTRVAEEPHRMFGSKTIAETWVLTL